MSVDREVSPAVTPPPGNPRFPLIDPMRGLAVAAVVVIHVGLVSGALDGSTSGYVLQTFGVYALPVLFALSGFLMYRPFVSARLRRTHPPAVLTYARRRLLRIVPAYWFALTVLGASIGLEGVFSSDWWRYYFFLQVYDSRTVGKGIPQAWSLCVEITFYALLPLWAAAATRFTRGSVVARVRTELLALAVVALFSGAAQILSSRGELPVFVGQTLLGQACWLALGMGLAVLSAAAERRLPLSLVNWFQAASMRAELCWGVSAMSFVGLIIVIQPGSSPAQDVVRFALGLALCTSLLVPAIFVTPTAGPAVRLLRLPIFSWFGLISYGVYLWHLTLASVLGLSNDPSHYGADLGFGLAATLPNPVTIWLFLATLAVSTAIAAFSYYVIELPFLRKKPGLSRRP